MFILFSFSSRMSESHSLVPVLPSWGSSKPRADFATSLDDGVLRPHQRPAGRQQHRAEPLIYKHGLISGETSIPPFEDTLDYIILFHWLLNTLITMFSFTASCHPNGSFSNAWCSSRIYTASHNLFGLFIYLFINPETLLGIYVLFSRDDLSEAAPFPYAT